MAIQASEQLKAKMEQYSIPEPNTGCFIWFGSCDQHGYGHLRIGGRSENGGHLVKAHRLAYELEFGPIPAGLHILHRCDNPWCVNPAHLFTGTAWDNCKDKMQKGRHAHGSKLPNAVLAGNEKLAEEVRSLYETGEFSQAQLARRYGISQATISRFCGGAFQDARWRGNQWVRRKLPYKG